MLLDMQTGGFTSGITTLQLKRDRIGNHADDVIFLSLRSVLDQLCLGTRTMTCARQNARFVRAKSKKCVSQNGGTEYTMAGEEKDLKEGDAMPPWISQLISGGI